MFGTLVIRTEMVQATLGKERIAREVLLFVLAEMAKDPEAERTKKQAIMDDVKHAYWKKHNANRKPAKDFDDAYELAVIKIPAYGKRGPKPALEAA